MKRHASILVLFPLTALVLAGCGPATPEARVVERAAVEFHCDEGQIQAKVLDPPATRHIEAKGCGREAVYINAAPEGQGENWVLEPPNSGQ